MPFVLAIIGITLIVTAIRGTSGTLFANLQADFTGSGNFIYWFISIGVIGSLGYVKKLAPITNLFLVLVLLVMFIANKGFFAQFMSAIKSPATNCGQTQGASVTTAQALAAAASATPSGSPGLGFSLPDLPSTQQIPDPVAGGAI